MYRFIIYSVKDNGYTAMLYAPSGTALTGMPVTDMDDGQGSTLPFPRVQGDAMPPPITAELMTIGEAVRLLRETYPDVSHSSLRFLQREGLIEPVRTPGGHRLYRQSDMERIRTIKRWQDQRLSLTNIRQRLTELDALADPARLSRRFLDFAIQGDTTAATKEILLADELGMPLGRLFDEVLKPALHEVGRLWAEGSLKVGQEHEISEVSRDLIAELSLRHSRPAPHMPVVVAACVSDEPHDLGLRMVCAFLRQRGVRVHFLGANVSATFLIEIVRMRQPDLVLLSVSIESRFPVLRSTVETLRIATKDQDYPRHIVAGGQGCASHQDEPGDPPLTILTGDRLEILTDRIMSL
jgi:DNA-binding transcriptional MerR regulator